MSLGMDVFSYYESGIFMSEITFENGDVNCKREGDSDWHAVNMDEHSFLLPLREASEIYSEANEANWDEKDECQLPSGRRLNRYLKMSGSVNGRQQQARVWVMPDAKQPVDLVVSCNQIVAFLFHAREDSAILVRNGYEELTSLKQWQDSLISKAEYSVRHLDSFRVMTRDGVQLATDVWLPAEIEEGSTVPAILIRTPYGRFNESVGGPHMFRFVHRGYAVVAQDTRGREDSEGEWMPNAHEIEDGDDVLNWIAAQPWSNGNVGMIGGSYGGFVQWAAAASGNSHLKAIVSLVTAGSPFADLPRKGGTILSGILAWSFMMADRKMNPEALNRSDWDEVLKSRPIKDIPKQALGKDIPFWTEWMGHTDYDEFWAKADWTRFGDKMNVPALYVSGWYDDDGMGTTEAWELNQGHGRDHQRLILGPWYHKANSTRQIHNVPFGNNAIRYDLDRLYLRWFDHFLKDMDNGVEQESKVEYYMVGENEWKTAKQWPPTNVTETKIYLHSDGKAQTKGGQLHYTEPEDQPSDTYDFDPKDAAPYLIDVSENECSVPENYKDVETREDVLVYTTAPLDIDVEIAGDLVAILYASSSAKDTDWVVRLTDVDEQGNSIRLSDGIIRARYRNSFERSALLQPGQVEKYEIRMTKIANQFKKGHRIRVSVTSGAENLAFPNQNTGNDPATDTDFVIARQTVYHNEQYPSHVCLPIIK